MAIHVVVQFAQSKLFITGIFPLWIYKILHRYIISYKNFTAPTEKDLFSYLSVNTCHRQLYNKAMIMPFLMFFRKILPSGSIEQLLIIIWIKL